MGQKVSKINQSTSNPVGCFGCRRSSHPPTDNHLNKHIHTKPDIIQSTNTIPGIDKHIPVLDPDDYEIEKYIAEGGMGVVYSAIQKNKNHKVAFKFFGYNETKVILEDIYREIDILSKVAGIDGMVQLYGVFMDSSSGYAEYKNDHTSYPVICMELLEGGDMFDRIQERKTVSEKYIANIFRGIVVALNGLHERRFLHRDLKLENLMLVSLEDNSPVKIIDVGMMVRMDEGTCVYQSENTQGTRGYVAPESLLNFQYSPKSDLWQAGCTLYSLLSGNGAFSPHKLEQTTEGTYFPMTGVAWNNISDDAKDLVSKLLERDPAKRYSAVEVLEHPWIKGEASDADMGKAYYTRIKNLALRQKMKTFFLDKNLLAGNSLRKEKLKGALPFLSPENKITASPMKLESMSCIEVPSILLEARRTLSLNNIECDPTAALDYAAYENKMKALKSMVVSSMAVKDSDDANDGEIDFPAFVTILLQCNLPELATPQVFKIFDIGRTGTIDLKDFLVTMVAFKDTDEVEESDTDAAVRFYFNMFDIDGTGSINIHELALVLSCIVADESNPLYMDASQLEPTSEDIQHLFDVIDTNKTGTIDFEEFKAFYETVLINSQKYLSEPAMVVEQLKKSSDKMLTPQK
mmetsp:Transcript_22186/g.32284  ORF Transcript_22186/g.32284 Transcript_22186/m.32284 type:complete len:633 (+) Transcript_22186:58-1956(+)|eukprot:CAMPEP_0185033108 /NCGR_PEP_ID=MMETSP1103-20130426/21757_1 /TAXON_ID=36769 /ORGANISM="Paraphysomonas bandaiensis, Strain Caron Lab Isolate" /LENGTH=632 /DNA_ID=CAMNT_0027569251 /DNA_START=24 /DNA_END=1922 /DNA_ORIENTATION=+